MKDNCSACEILHSIARIPIALINNDGTVCRIWPGLPSDYVLRGTLELVVTDFRLQKKDVLHPLITFIQPGYFMGVCSLPGDQYAIIGLAGQAPHSRQEILAVCQPIINPACLQQFLDMMMAMPLFSLEQVENLMILLVQLTWGAEIPRENIQMNDIFIHEANDSHGLPIETFAAREIGEFHIPLDFETAICRAVEHGSREELMKILYSPARGRVGKMSANELRQQKYGAICIVTVLCRTAIRAGLSEEVSFGISDTFCQHIDRLNDAAQIQRRVFTMMMEYCDRVRELKAKSQYSTVVQKCLDYISVHLHESISLGDLSKHCGLCSRSLSQRFKKEMDIGIPDYVHLQKIEESKYLLQHTEYSLSEIACFLNYPSQSYFTQIFKRYTGATPQQFRDHPY